MAARKSGGKKAARKARRETSPRKRASARKRITVRTEKRGLEGAEILLALGSAEVAPLVARVEGAGGTAIGAYREPLSGRPLLLASLPIGSVEPTPFQRDLSPTHTKRLARKIEESGSFLDPLIVVWGSGGALWTPNGRHRLASAKVLGLRQVTALVSPDEDLAFRILALNTEKAHNLKDRSLEVIRMARELALRRKRAKESEFAAEFEEPQLLTLGLAYEENKRFGGGAYGPLLKKVDRFSERTLAARGLGRAADRDRRLGETRRRGAARARLQVTLSSQLRGGAHQPGAFPPAPKGRCQASHGHGRGSHPHGRRGAEVRHWLGARERPRPGSGRRGRH
jgi:ParB family chromosome partitioning protein